MLVFSEFGRRVAENGSLGTDHGTAGPVFLAGPRVRPGLHGAYPSLTDLDDGDLKMTVDFRRVYATVLEGWLGLAVEGGPGRRLRAPAAVPGRGRPRGTRCRSPAADGCRPSERVRWGSLCGPGRGDEPRPADPTKTGSGGREMRPLRLRSRRLQLSISALTVAIAVLALVFAVRPISEREAILIATRPGGGRSPQVARSDDYEVRAQWLDAEKCWRVSFVISRPFVFCHVRVYRDRSIKVANWLSFLGIPFPQESDGSPRRALIDAARSGPLRSRTVGWATGTGRSQCRFSANPTCPR